MEPLPGRAESCWTAAATPTRYPRLARSQRTEVAVVGGGIVGLTAAYLLTAAGCAVTVLEARRVGRQVTGRSTAKITSQHRLIYSHLARSLGDERALLYAEANHCGVELVIALARNLALECDLERTSAFAYARDDARIGALEAEARLAQGFGFAADVVRPAPLPFATAGALRFAHQAQFNPAKYLVGLAAAVNAGGGRIFEQSRVGKVARSGGRWCVDVGDHAVESDHVVVATALPIGGPIHFDEQTRPRCHIAMAFRADPSAMLDGMFIDVDQPSHSLRMGRDRDGPLLVALGPTFPTGHDGDVATRMRELEAWIRARIPAGGVAWRWVNEDYDTDDRIPYAGELTKKAPGMYVATGFNGWGISNGTAAAMLVADQIQGLRNPWQALYNPERRASARFNQGGETRSAVARIAAIAPGSGGIVRNGEDRIAVYRMAGGTLRAFSAACTHMGCTVTWNNADSTWDCPCHGSVFADDGAVIHGPATKALKRVRVPSDEDRSARQSKP